MPKYTIRNTQTAEVSDFWGSYDEMKSYIAENPELTNVIGCPKIISGQGGGSVTDNTNKLPDGFKDKLREIKRKHPQSSGVDHLI